MRRRGLPQKSILERKARPTFDIAVEMWERYRWSVHKDVAETIDNLLRDRDPGRQIRAVSETGSVTVTEEKPRAPEIHRNPAVRGWRASGRMKPLPVEQTVETREWQAETPSNGTSDHEIEDESEDLSFSPPARDRSESDEVFYIYLYGVSRHQAEQAIAALQLPVLVTKEIDGADAILALRSQVRSHSKLRHVAETRQLPVHAIKSSTLPQITRALRRMLHMDESAIEASAINDLSLFAYGDSEDEMEALEEARLAVEQIVIPKGQPVELLPRSSIIRRMQHELVEHYHLRSTSFGTEPNRRLRIYPN
jgi:hypothetical protein